MAGLIGAHNSQVFSSRALRRSPIPGLIASRVFEISFRNPSTAMRDSKPLLSVSASLKQPAKTISATQFGNIRPSEDVLKIWNCADAVCFDVDSTVCLDEGIDELADFCGSGKAVEEWTKRAMSGSVPFEEALAARLSLFNPSYLQVQEFLEKRPPRVRIDITRHRQFYDTLSKIGPLWWSHRVKYRISPGIAELIEKLMAKNIVVHLISGGFRQMINPVALQLGIPLENVFANNLLFGSAGEYVGFDANEPTSRSGGKATAVQHIRKVHNYKTMIMIGDGATDLEARAPGGADLFICYAGVVLREAVAAKADWLIFDFQELLAYLP